MDEGSCSVNPSVSSTGISKGANSDRKSSSEVVDVSASDRTEGERDGGSEDDDVGDSGGISWTGVLSDEDIVGSRRTDCCRLQLA